MRVLLTGAAKLKRLPSRRAVATFTVSPPSTARTARTTCPTVPGATSSHPPGGLPESRNAHLGHRLAPAALRLRRRRMRYDLVRTGERHEPRHQHQGDRRARHAPHREPRDYPSCHSWRRRDRANVVLPHRIRSCRRRGSTNVLCRHQRPRRRPLRVRHRRYRVSNATRDGRRRRSNTRRLLPAAALCRGRPHGGALALAATPARARQELQSGKRGQRGSGGAVNGARCGQPGARQRARLTFCPPWRHGGRG
jgi:hypothetical protein